MLAAAVPVVVAVGVAGISFGALAAGTGITAWAATLMSATVFAGSAQFAFVSVLGSGGTVLAAVLAGGLLNARYLAIGAAVARSLPGRPLTRAVLAQLVTDESFSVAVGVGTPEEPDRRALLVTGAALWTAWVGGTLVGALLGRAVGDPETLGLDAAFPALFVGLLWPLLDRSAAVRAALAGAAVALALGPLTPAGVPFAAAAAAGLLLAAKPTPAG